MILSRLNSVIREVSNILPEAEFVMIHSAGGFTAIFSLSDFLAPDVSFAIKHNGELLTQEPRATEPGVFLRGNRSLYFGMGALAAVT
jgi:DMSO/TMAO reductase YedYZ molybdopterin-dependent catalytic subunit